MAPMVAPLPHGLKPKRKWDTDGPMKRANWKAIIPQKLSENSFWVKVQEDKLADDEILSGLAMKFSSKPMKQADKDSVDRPPSSKKNVDLRVLDGKAAQNLLILLGGSLKHLSHEQIRTYLLRCDTTILGPNVLQQLIQYLPPPDQLKRLQEIRARGEELAAPEAFAATIGDIKRLGARLQSLNSCAVGEEQRIQQATRFRTIVFRHFAARPEGPQNHSADKRLTEHQTRTPAGPISRSQLDKMQINFPQSATIND